MGRRNKKVKRGDGGVGLPTPSSSDGGEVVVASSSSSSSAVVDARTGDGADDGGRGHVNVSSVLVGFGLDEGRHPLLNSVVLANLLRYCPDLAELRRWRLVCKTWCGESLSIWRSTATVKLSCGRPSDPFNSIYVGAVGSRTTLTQFLIFLGDGQAKPFRQFHLKGWSFAPPEVRKLLGSGGGQLDRFWRYVGPSLTSLTLNGCDFASGEVFGKLIFKSSPSLRSLTLTGSNKYSNFQTEHFQSEAELVRQLRQKAVEEPIFGEHRNLKSLTVDMEAGQQFPMTWLQFLCHFPCLEALKLVYVYSPDQNPHNLLEILISIDMIRQQDGEKLPLNGFDIVNGSVECSTARNSLQFLDMFRRLGLPLRDLNICLDPDLEETQLKEVLQSHSRHLRQIEVWRMSPNGLAHNRPLWRFPFGVELTNLEELSIAEGFCSSFEFLKHTPNLGKLKILGDLDGSSPSPTSLVSNTCEFAGLRMLNLKTFTLGYKVEDNDLRRLINWFPNLKLLTMPLNDIQFSTVCEHCRGLRHLHVIGNELTNVGVTGSTGRQKSTKPNITHLENLRCFEIEKMKSALSDTSAFHGFLKLPNLRRLGVQSESNNFGIKARNALKSRIPQCHLNKDSCDGFEYFSGFRFSMFSCNRFWE